MTLRTCWYSEPTQVRTLRVKWFMWKYTRRSKNVCHHSCNDLTQVAWNLVGTRLGWIIVTVSKPPRCVEAKLCELCRSPRTCVKDNIAHLTLFSTGRSALYVSRLIVPGKRSKGRTGKNCEFLFLTMSCHKETGKDSHTWAISWEPRQELLVSLDSRLQREWRHKSVSF